MSLSGQTLNPRLTAELPVLDGVVRLFHPYVEVILHDLESGTIAAVFNDLSQSTGGDRSAISKFVGEQAGAFPDVFEPYYRINWDGRKFKCVAVTLRDEAGAPVGLVCVNFDVSVFEGFSLQLETLLTIGRKDTLSPIEQFTEDWRQRVNECVGNFLKENQATLEALTTEQKRAAVNRLYAHGLFNYRKAAAYIAGQLKVSRATVYNYLKEG